MNNFQKTIQWSLLTNRRQYTNNALGLTLALFLIMAIDTGMASGYSGGLEPLGEGSRASYFIAMVVASAVIASQICSDLKTKQLRSQYLMLPASCRNKFWSRVLIAFLQGFVMFAVALFAADLLQMLISLIFNGDAYSASKVFFSVSPGGAYVAYDETNPVLKSITAHTAYVATAAWGFTSYVLGGFLFRKMPLLMTTVGWVIFWMVVVTGGISIAAHFLDRMAGDEQVYFLWDSTPVVNITVTIIGMIFTVFNLCLSYYRFRRMTINPTGWLN